MLNGNNQVHINSNFRNGILFNTHQRLAGKIITFFTHFKIACQRMNSFFRRSIWRLRAKIKHWVAVAFQIYLICLNEERKMWKATVHKAHMISCNLTLVEFFHFGCVCAWALSDNIDNCWYREWMMTSQKIESATSNQFLYLFFNSADSSVFYCYRAFRRDSINFNRNFYHAINRYE